MPDSFTTVVGAAGRDAELRFTGSGKAVASFSLAVSRRWKPQNSDKWEEVTTWYDISCWDQMAENVAASIRKGTRVVVTGTVEQREYETKEGETRKVLEIRPEEIAVSLRWAAAVVERNERDKPTSAPRRDEPEEAF